MRLDDLTICNWLAKGFVNEVVIVAVIAIWQLCRTSGLWGAAFKGNDRSIISTEGEI